LLSSRDQNCICRVASQNGDNEASDACAQHISPVERLEQSFYPGQGEPPACSISRRSALSFQGRDRDDSRMTGEQEVGRYGERIGTRPSRHSRTSIN
jgi:hypothetical protein